MNIYHTTYKDIPAIVVETAALRATFLPGQGGKLTSLVRRATGREYMQQRPGDIYRPLGLDTDYVSAECDAYDDMFPTIDPWADGEVRYLDHGEVCRLPHIFEETDNTLRTRVETTAFPAVFARDISENSRGGLRIDFTVKSTANRDLDFIWATHFMAVAEEGGQLVSPFPDGTTARLMFADRPAVYGVQNQELSYPLAADGTTRLDLSGPCTPDIPNERKYYMTTPFPAGYWGYHYPSDSTRLMLRFDPAQVPYAGVWMNDGTSKFPGYYNVALEICTGNYDRPDTARENGQFSVLHAGSTVSWYLEIDIEKI